MPRIALFLLVTLLTSACATPGQTEPPELANLPRFDLGNSPRLGEPTARIAMVDFSDYQCPICARLDIELLPALVRDYVNNGVVQIVHKDFPLPMHPQAIPAAIAARCAGSQGRFWEMHRKLLYRQLHLGEKFYRELAAELKLDIEKFDACRGDPATRAGVMRDVRLGRALGVSATPTLLLGRVYGDRFVVERMAAGLPEYQQLVTEIERLRSRLDARAPVAAHGQTAAK